MQEAVKRQTGTAIKAMFWVTVAIFILVLSSVVIDNISDYISFGVSFFVLGGIGVLLGIAIIILVARSGYDRISRSFLILTGSSIAGILVGSVLHNLIYGLVMEFGGDSRIFESIGGFFEGAFFIIGTLISPVGFVAGTIGTIVLMAKKRI